MRPVGFLSSFSLAALPILAACTEAPDPSGADSGGSGSAAVPASGGSTSAGGSGGSAGAAAIGSGGSLPPGLAEPGAPATAEDLGESVVIFDPATPNEVIQTRLTEIFTAQESAQFSTDRYALMFLPGEYNLDVRVGYYSEVLGLGRVPSDVVITGAVRVTAEWFGGNATHNFWRACANLSVVPTQNGNNTWAVSQGAALRRTHIRGALSLSAGGWSSGGFLADAKVDGVTQPGSQQQWFSRNTDFGGWQGGVWNMVFVGSPNAPTGTWPASPYTVLEETPILREKPFLFVDDSGQFSVMLPSLDTDTRGPSWAAGSRGTALSTGYFYVANPDKDDAASMSLALSSGRNLLLTPGIYRLEDSINVTRPGSIVLGLGLATLVPENGTPAIRISDVDGVTLAGVMFDAGPVSSATLLEVGEQGSSADHASQPISLFDVFCRIGGGSPGTARSCVTINSSDVIGDNFWLWRADHGAGVGWDSNRSATGLTVNGDDVTIYGLAVEHFQEYQTIWNGNGGRVYFYQSELPYDPPNQEAWQHDGVNGWASYKVADHVTTHEAWGVGIYSAFRQAVVADTAIEAPLTPGVRFRHVVTIFLDGPSGSGIQHILNDTGAAVSSSNQRATLD